jgi:hypothetical protein
VSGIYRILHSPPQHEAGVLAAEAEAVLEGDAHLGAAGDVRHIVQVALRTARSRYTAGVAWEIEYTDEFFAWWETLTELEEQAVSTAVERLEEAGPALGRPFVDTIHRSRHANMKELRPRGSNIRMLFAFNPLRTAILLIGGDKTGRWEEWYETMVPIADDLYDEHLRELKREGAL